MERLGPDQRNYFYLIEAERAGIHKPILAALYAVQRRPDLTDGETGLGIAPVHRLPLARVNRFPKQVQYAANTIRSITDTLTAQGWQGGDLWDGSQGRYTDKLVHKIAEGYVPPASDAMAAQLERSDPNALLQAYIDDLTMDYRADQLSQNLGDLDPALLSFAERIPRYYAGHPAQRDALLEAVRIWRKLDSREAVIASLSKTPPTGLPEEVIDEAFLDNALRQFLKQVVRYYSGYPYQREALLRLVQLWRQLDSREEAIAALQDRPTAETNLEIVDPALIAFVQRIPQFYQNRGDQRFALTEAYRIWQQLDSRSTALRTLGINPQALAANPTDQRAIADAAAQLDQELINFIHRIPSTYEETDYQREALIRLVQIWRRIDGRTPTIQSLFEDIRRMQAASRDSPDAAPPPEPAPIPSRPSRWTPDNLQMGMSIIPNGSFYWSEATRGGTRMPPNQETVDAMIRIAELAQQARDRIGRPFHITSWYRPAAINARVGGASRSRHIVGDAIDFYCDGLTGNQVYWALDPWWPSGLGRYRSFPYLVHMDARGYRARWRH